MKRTRCLWQNEGVIEKEMCREKLQTKEENNKEKDKTMK